MRHSEAFDLKRALQTALFSGGLVQPQRRKHAAFGAVLASHHRARTTKKLHC